MVVIHVHPEKIGGLMTKHNHYGYYWPTITLGIKLIHAPFTLNPMEILGSRLIHH